MEAVLIRRHTYIFCSIDQNISILHWGGRSRALFSQKTWQNLGRNIDLWCVCVCDLFKLEEHFLYDSCHSREFSEYGQRDIEVKCIVFCNLRFCRDGILLSDLATKTSSCGQ